MFKMCLQIHIMFHQPHSSISRPTFLIVVAYNVFIVRVRVLSQVPLDQISCLISRKPEYKKTRLPKIYCSLENKCLKSLRLWF